MEVEIGQAAGKVWQTLHAKGAMTKNDLGKATGLSTDMLNLAVGWLAREGKLAFGKGKAGPTIGLKK
jgi:hypothetical protein